MCGAMRRWIRITVSLAAAVALHALLLLPLPRRERPAPRQLTLKVELVEQRKPEPQPRHEIQQSLPRGLVQQLAVEDNRIDFRRVVNVRDGIRVQEHEVCQFPGRDSAE